MKQLVPFAVIILLIGAVIFFMQDDYEGPFGPDYSSEASDSFWDAVLYVNEDNGEFDIGIRLELIAENINPENIEAIEIFVDSSAIGFFYQELELDEFDGTVDYSEPCSACENISQIEARVLVNWSDQETRSSQYQFSLSLDE